MERLFCPIMNRFLLLLFFLASRTIVGQAPCEINTDIPFAFGEVIEYELNYNWGLLWLSAGDATFEVLKPKKDPSSYYHLRGIGKSRESWDWFYKVYSIYESYTDEKLIPYRSSRMGDEGSHYYNDTYTVEGDSVYFTSYDQAENVKRKNKTKLLDCALDVTTAVYYCRTLDFDKLEPNEIIDLNMYLDGSMEDTYVRYLGVENWTDPRSKETIECLVLKPNLIDGSVFKSGENMTVYVRNDEHKVPVYIETKLVVGKAKIYLTKHIPGSQ